MGVRIAAGLHSAILAIAIGSRLTPFLCIGIFLKKRAPVQVLHACAKFGN